MLLKDMSNAYFMYLYIILLRKIIFKYLKCAVMDVSQYQFSFGTHQGRNIIWIQFKYQLSLKDALRERFPSARYSSTHKAWYLPDLATVRKELKLPLKTLEEQTFSHISENNRLAVTQYCNHLDLLAYSPHTKRTYLQEFMQLLSLLGNVSVNSLTPDRLKDYFLYCLQKNELKEQSMNSKINAIKFYFEKVLHREQMFFDIPRPKSPLTLPKMLSKNEIVKLFSVLENKKHRLILKLCYGMGLRVGEIVNLKIEHIDSQSMRVLIVNAKGKKDRYTNLPESVLEDLRAYYLEYRPKTWLFEGAYGGNYSIRSIQAVFKSAMKKAKITKTIGIHGLRHSYATHLIEGGADIRFLQKLLGHSNLKTTQIYTHVTDVTLSKIKSPLDGLSL
ncbi:tyrosine-type recombinase/integrase [Flavobacterium columnare]|uniref:tyrosine-type recombinase/integrase n=1 Tax=Flavobacterium columnare TaxID=996 RepID=UPI003B9F8631